MSDLLALADEIERAAEGSRELDADIYEAFGNEVIRRPKHINGYAWKYRPGYGQWQNMERYTTSFDAALSLVPDGFELELTNLYGVARVGVGLNFCPGPFYGSNECGCLALALCAASLRAIHQGRSK